MSLIPRTRHLLVRRVWRGCYPMTPDAVPIVDNVSFDRSVLFVIRYVTEALRKREDFDAEALR